MIELSGKMFFTNISEKNLAIIKSFINDISLKHGIFLKIKKKWFSDSFVLKINGSMDISSGELEDGLLFIEQNSTISSCSISFYPIGYRWEDELRLIDDNLMFIKTRPGFNRPWKLMCNNPNLSNNIS